MAKRILTVGYEIPGGASEYIPYRSDRSVLDGDIIIFQPDLSDLFTSDTYQGLPSYSEDASFKIQRTAEHWKAEISAALKAAKTVVVYLTKVERFFLDTGKRTYSGTGRNQKVTRFVGESDNYQFLPVSLGVAGATGQLIKPSSSIGFLAPYWSEFGPRSKYELYFNAKVSRVLLTAGATDRIVGALIKLKDVSGSLILLPPIVADDSDFTRYDDSQKKTFWTKAGRAFGARLAAALVGIDAQLRKSSAGTPEPQWAASPTYSIATEEPHNRRISECDTEIQRLNSVRAEALEKLEQERSFRRLLYETGTPLEDAIRSSLQFIGFKAENYKNADSEFDVIFSSDEGRLLGEAEGKDNKAINIDKFSQLERNLHEDFERDSVPEMAKGVLFGNAFRLIPVDQRSDFFTEKCLSAAKRIGAALIRTPDLFMVVQTLKESWSDSYAERCRRTILDANGIIVVFPLRKATAAKRGGKQPESEVA